MIQCGHESKEESRSFCQVDLDAGYLSIGVSLCCPSSPESICRSWVFRTSRRARWHTAEKGSVLPETDDEVPTGPSVAVNNFRAAFFVQWYELEGTPLLQNRNVSTPTRSLLALCDHTALSFLRSRFFTLKGFLISLIRRIISLILFSRCSGESSSRKLPLPVS